ncbi:UNVERIFIED_CONTAM: hypothetical protein Sradi_6962500 [Sesamum radiatum]|uniref:Uncharacterized protein n=1 Tax=Sesamum radiatum TaxID=300843 RepID=A0AAW2JHD7_SESRA
MEALYRGDFYVCSNTKNESSEGSIPSPTKKKGDLALNVKLAAELPSIAQCILHLDRHNSLILCLEACYRLIFVKATKLEQCMLQQRAKCNGCEAGISAHGCSFGKLPSVGLQKGYTKSILP